MKLKRDTGNVYKPNSLMRLFFMLMGLFGAGLPFYLSRNTDFSSMGAFGIFFIVFIFLLCVVIAWFGVMFVIQTRVTVSEDGLDLQRGGSHLFTTWENISHFGIKGRGRAIQSGVYLHNIVKPQVSGLLERIFFSWQTNFIPIGVVIDLPAHWYSINLEKLAQTDFGHDVALYAPHLLKEQHEKSKPNN